MSQDYPPNHRRKSPPSKSNAEGITRREFVISSGALTAGVIIGAQAHPASAAMVEESRASSVDLELTLNGTRRKFSVDPRVTLLDLLREHADLTGTKKGCDHGQCGACTVLANGRRINSCLSLAAVHHGDSIVTIEGLARGEELHPMQAAFVEYDGFQCGYCTPGQICSAVALLQEAQRGDASMVTGDLAKIEPVDLTPEEIRERMSGNICRCGAYPQIVQAISHCAATIKA
jgi:xanthine dehydrogenase YagT iron-sulfur-binding subunit